MTQPNEIPRRTRRRFLYQLAIAGIGGFVSLLVAGPLAGFFFAVLMNREALQWVKVASLDEISSIEPREFRVAFRETNASVPWEAVLGVFVIRQGDAVLPFVNVCTHVGCSVRWLPWRQQLVCPCHASVYDRWGHVMGGPAASDLPYLLSKIEGNDLYVANRVITRGVQTGGF